MPETRLPKQLYKWETRLNRNNWYTDLKKVFISIKNQDIDTPDPDSICLTNVVNNALKELTLHEESHWINDLQQAAKLRTYRLCKRERQTENYLRVRLNRQQRSMLCQLRCGILPLRIETGHYGPKPLPPEDRICLLCNLEPETELHFFITLLFVSSTETDILCISE